jgi:hypothetical protein
MGIYVYCLGTPDHPPPVGITGVEQASVSAESVGRFSIWVSELEHAPTSSLDGVRAHNAVVEAATARRTPLPFRFGQWFPTREDLVRSLDEQTDRWTARLEHVDGALEYGLRIVDPRHTTLPPDRSSGTAYLEVLALRSRQDQLDQERGRAIAAACRERLGSLVRDERVHHVGGGTLAVIAHLVGRHDTGNYERAAGEIPAEWPDLRFFSTGPWPPYGFT